MELCLELNPERYVIVLGPQFSAAILSQSDAGKTLALSYCAVIEVAITMVSSTLTNEAERSKFEVLHKHAYELDPLFAFAKVTAKLKQLDLYEQWLHKAFACQSDVPSADSLQHLLELQRKGALLVYTHCDDTLERAVRLPPVLPKDADSWAMGKQAGFLHVHGVYSSPESVMLDYALYENASHPQYNKVQSLLKYFRGRRIVCIGFDDHLDDPLQAKFLESLPRDGEQHHMILTSTPVSKVSLLPLLVPCDVRGLENVLRTVASSSQALWSQIEFPNSLVDNTLVISLLVAGKQGCSEISSMMFKAPGVNFALVSPLSYGGGHVHMVLIRVKASELFELWNWIFINENSLLVAKGLIGVALKCGTIIWIKGKLPEKNQGLPTSKEECANSLIQLSESSPRRSSDAVNENLMKSLLMMKSQALAPPPLTHIPNLSGGIGSSLRVSLQQQCQVARSHSDSPLRVSLQQQCQVARSDRPMTEAAREAGTAAYLHGSPDRLLSKRRGSLPPQLLTRSNEGCSLTQFDDQNQAQMITKVSLPPPTTTTTTSSDCHLPYMFHLQKRISNGSSGSDAILSGEKGGLSMLKNLLLLKPKADPPLTSTLHRRKSDPGTALANEESFIRRKELFYNESKAWSESLQIQMERKALQRRQTKLKRLQTHSMSEAKESIPKLLPGLMPPGIVGQPNLSIATINTASNGKVSAMATSTTPPPAVLIQSRYPSGFSPYLFSPPVVSMPSTVSAATSAPPVLYNPLIQPYAIVNPYHPVQSPAYLLPSNPATQKVVYFVPGSNAAVTVSSSSDPTTKYSPLGVPLTIPSLMPPISASIVKQDSSKPILSVGNQQGPNNLVLSLLKNTSSLDSDPETPPPVKRKRSGDSAASDSYSSQLSPAISKDLRTLLEKQQVETLKEQGMDDLKCNWTQPSGSHNCGMQDLPRCALVGPQNGGNGQQQVQLWQFLLELLLSHSQLIQWTDQDLEFQISQPDKVAELWGRIRNDPKMTYQKLAKGLCYYYTQGILKSVPEKFLTFRYTSWLKNYIVQRQSQAAVESTKEVLVME